jgi:hypothetical protein
MVTQEAVRLYRTLRALPRRGHYDERIRLELALHAALGLQPWHPYVSDVRTDEPPRSDGGAYAQTWPHVWKLRRQLEKEVKVADARSTDRPRTSHPPASQQCLKGRAA